MPPSTESPIQQLITTWRRLSPPEPTQVEMYRGELYATALREMGHRYGTHHRPYDPELDPRFKWAVQWLHRAEGYINRIDPDVEFATAFMLNPNPIQYHPHHEPNP